MVTSATHNGSNTRKVRRPYGVLAREGTEGATAAVQRGNPRVSSFLFCF
ncbi:hypothetical protein ES332_D05G431200v1 [Gossypium tomentosum]|uniref:Uncharacterized protein n=1 Tax=Gossypium tomentosum TaxID=34277 RepID=A0A5D2L6B5_GOSTO|nr:hypothetical protein ES332_D05G431200v1 [Gossypium tomentosum]